MSTTIPIISEPAAAVSADFDIPVKLHMLDEANRIVDARLRQASPALFELSCSESLHAGQRLALSHSGHRLGVEVLSAVESQPGLFLLAVRVVAEEHGEARAELRLPTNLSVVVYVAGATDGIAARVSDVSPSGMGLEVSKPLAEGAKVCVSLEQGLAFGEIRFCQETSPDLYTAGFKLAEYICQ